MSKKRNSEINIRSSAAEYLTYIASVGNETDSFEVRYEDENIWLTQKMLATIYDVDVRTKVTAAIAKLHAESEFEKYRIVQDQLFMSDYDKYMLELEEK